MLTEIQQPTPVGKRSLENAVSPTSTKADLIAWLHGIIPRKEFSKLKLNGVEASDLFDCQSAEVCQRRVVLQTAPTDRACVRYLHRPNENLWF
jgi:hypothetical protein